MKLSLCSHCFCMTKTVKDKCGKCKNRKENKIICIFCGKEFKKKDKIRYGICVSCKIDMLRTMKKSEYNLLVKGEDVKLVTGRLVRELKGQGYKVIK